MIPCFLTEKSALKLVFSVLMRDRLREELGIKEEPQDMQELEEVCN